ncbi:MAG: ABC transporter ATP-binding protein/permease [Candidatus Omnitrophota bacterium]
MKKNIFNIVFKGSKKVRYILKLVVATPRYGWILILQIFSGLFSFVGLPMLLPVLDYLKGGSASPNTTMSLNVPEKILSFFGMEPDFQSMLVFAVVLILTSQFLVFASALIALNAQTEIARRYRQKIFNAYRKTDWQWLLDTRSGEMNYSVIVEAPKASVAYLNAQRVLIYLIQVSVLLVVVMRMSLPVTLMAMGLYSILTGINLLNSSFVHKLASKQNLKSIKLSNDLTVLQQNKKFFKTALLNEKLIKAMFGLVDNVSRLIKKQNFHVELQHSWNLMFSFLFLAVLMYFHKQLSLGYSELLLILLIFLKLAPHFASLSTAYVALDTDIPVYRSLHERLDGLCGHEEENGGVEFNENDSITFRDVNFSYRDGNNIFKGLNFTIEHGKTTAFIGASGVGKSTLLDLILGLLKPDSGSICYGNISHDRLDKNSIRSRIAYVSQATTLIDGTIKDNLTIGVPGFTDEKLKSITRKVVLDEVIMKMPKGIETHIGENGVKLSGGQRQRVALARALFVDPSILILDEATSSLDSESERLIQETIKCLQKDFTIIIVTHKLSSVRFADRIYVLENGRICESGNYEELLKQKGKLYFFDSRQKR